MLRTLRTLLVATTLAAAATTTAQIANPPAHEGSKLIKWMSMEAAQAAAQKAPKPLFVDVYTPWCGPCRMLDAKTFNDPKLADYVNKHFYPVKFNAESGDPVTFKGEKLTNPDFNPAMVGGRNGTHQLTYKIAVTERGIAYPTVVYLDSDLNVLAPVQGLMGPQEMEPILAYFGEGVYKNQDYQSFLGTFKSRWTAP